MGQTVCLQHDSSYYIPAALKDMCGLQARQLDTRDWRRLAANPWMFGALAVVLNAAVQVRTHGTMVVWWLLPTPSI